MYSGMPQEKLASLKNDYQNIFSAIKSDFKTHPWWTIMVSLPFWTGFLTSLTLEATPKVLQYGQNKISEAIIQPNIHQVEKALAGLGSSIKTGFAWLTNQYDKLANYIAENQVELDPQPGDVEDYVGYDPQASAMVDYDQLSDAAVIPALSTRKIVAELQSAQSTNIAGIAGLKGELASTKAQRCVDILTQLEDRVHSLNPQNPEEAKDALNTLKKDIGDASDQLDEVLGAIRKGPR